VVEQPPGQGDGLESRFGGHQRDGAVVGRVLADLAAPVTQGVVRGRRPKRHRSLQPVFPARHELGDEQAVAVVERSAPVAEQLGRRVHAPRHVRATQPRLVAERALEDAGERNFAPDPHEAGDVADGVHPWGSHARLVSDAVKPGLVHQLEMPAVQGLEGAQQCGDIVAATADELARCVRGGDQDGAAIREAPERRKPGRRPCRQRRHAVAVHRPARRQPLGGRRRERVHLDPVTPQLPRQRHRAVVDIEQDGAREEVHNHQSLRGSRARCGSFALSAGWERPPERLLTCSRCGRDPGARRRDVILKRGRAS